MDEIKQQVADKLKQANNILVTVRDSPTVDLLCACIGLALVLDKMDKHATAVFSGEVPDAMQFLKPEQTIEPTPNSLRDFIITLDMSKADKLRYKKDDQKGIVQIFITPYKTSITQDDLDFSQGDFNIDVVVALGAHEQAELDAAITAHGRILHDATVISINNTPNGSLGSLNWQDTKASSVSEMVTQLVDDMRREALDGQIATALLTGIVAETARFSNDKTTPKTMTLAGELMAAGANQQLVANELQANGQLSAPALSPPKQATGHSDDGALDIEHPADPEKAKPEPEPAKAEPAAPEHSKPAEREMLPMPEPGRLGSVQDASNDLFSEEFADEPSTAAGEAFLVDAPSVPGPAAKAYTPPFTLPTSQEPPLEPPKVEPLADKVMEQPAPEPFTLPGQPSKPASDADLKPPPGSQTLEELERSVDSPHVEHGTPSSPLGEAEARSKVLEALNQGPHPLNRLEPVEALNANPLADSLHAHDEPALPRPPQDAPPPASSEIGIDKEGNFVPSAPALDMPLPPVVPSPDASSPELPPVTDQSDDKAPPVPPPIPGLFNP